MSSIGINSVSNVLLKVFSVAYKIMNLLLWTVFQYLDEIALDEQGVTD